METGADVPNTIISSKLAKARKLLAQGKLESAKNLYESLCHRNRKNPEAWLALARINLTSGNTGQAKTCCNEVLAIQTDHAEARLVLGMIYHTLRQFGEAGDCYRKSLKLNPKQQVALFNLGSIAQEQNKIDEAIECYNKAIRLNPGYVRAYANLGHIFRSRGELENALHNYRKACKHAPDIAEIHYSLGLTLYDTHRIEEAVKHFYSAIHLKNDYSDAHIALASLHLQRGEHKQAIADCEQALKTLPNDVRLLNLAGSVLTTVGDSKKARNHLNRALALQPDNIDTLCGLTNLFMANDQMDDALKYAGRAQVSAPDNVNTQYFLGKLYRQTGDFDSAMKHYEAGLEISPGNIGIIADSASILETRGKFQKALELIQPYLHETPAHRGILGVFSALSRHFGTQEDAIRLMQQYVSQGGASLIDCIDIHQELGKHYDKSGDYDKAFEHYHLFNEGLRLSSMEWVNHYKPEAQAEETAEWKTMYPADFWSGLERAGNTSKRPVFIVGMPRSGTSLTEQILASHPDVFGAGELAKISELAHSLSLSLGDKTKFPGSLGGISAQTLDALASQYLEHLDYLNTSASRVTDKLPTNFWYLGLISTLFPTASILHIKRHPLDTCLSMYFQKFGASMPLTTDLSQLGAYYNMYNSVMKYWKSVLDIPIHEVRYEDLVAEPETIIRGIIAFCGLEWNEHCLEFHKLERDVNTPSYDQVRRPIYATSSGRWQHYEKHLTTLIEILGPSLQDS